ncbi:phage tail sheath family protein [Halococcus agarilyticus]|uniref:phage tail sheath family protein n=1 Tax=Halococcus agarilyticus TaxID=1232219 RepID=UPI0006777DF3|nr:phage tail sheath subtilisin-like domain-containing protein [Halococcus agarilyticus]
MPEYTSPGVYVEEVEQGAKPIEGVETSTAGFLGETERGPEDPQLLTDYTDYQRYFGGTVENRYLAQAVDGFFQNGGSHCYVGRITPENTATAKGDLPPLRSTTDMLEIDVSESIIELSAIGSGDWGTGVAVTVADASLYTPNENDLFQLTVRYWSDLTDRKAAKSVLANPDVDIDEAPNPDAEEVYDNLTTDEASTDYYGTVLDKNSALVEVVKENIQNGLRPANGTMWLDSTFPNETVTASDYEGDLTAEPDERTGFAAFEGIDEISIVCVPDENEYSNRLAETIVTHCTKQKDRFAILQSEKQPEGLETLQPSVRSNFAAFYYPWLTVEHPETGQDQEVPPGGHVAGIYARSDQEHGVHKAPANESVRGIRGLQLNISKGDQDVLNPRGVNCIRTFSDRGTRIWGARTTSDDPSWKYVNVRRLFLFIEESIDKGTQWVVSYPNDEQLWRRVRQSIQNFLTSVWQDGALMGTTPEEAFYVKCDRSTMTTRYRLRPRPDQQRLLFPESAGNHGSMAQYSRPRTPVSPPTTVGARARSRYRPR